MRPRFKDQSSPRDFLESLDDEARLKLRRARRFEQKSYEPKPYHVEDDEALRELEAALKKGK